MTTLRKQLDQANKRIEYLEMEINALEGICIGRINPEMFSRILQALASFVSTKELVGILIPTESKGKDDE